MPRGDVVWYTMKDHPTLRFQHRSPETRDRVDAETRNGVLPVVSRAVRLRARRSGPQGRGRHREVRQAARRSRRRLLGNERTVLRPLQRVPQLAGESSAVGNQARRRLFRQPEVRQVLQGHGGGHGPPIRLRAPLPGLPEHPRVQRARPRASAGTRQHLLAGARTHRDTHGHQRRLSEHDDVVELRQLDRVPAEDRLDQSQPVYDRSVHRGAVAGAQHDAAAGRRPARADGLAALLAVHPLSVSDELPVLLLPELDRARHPQLSVRRCSRRLR